MRYPEFRSQHLCRLRCHRSRLQDGHRFPLQIRDVLDRSRGQRHPGSPILPHQWPLRGLLGGSPGLQGLISTFMSHTPRPTRPTPVKPGGTASRPFGPTWPKSYPESCGYWDIAWSAALSSPRHIRRDVQSSAAPVHKGSVAGRPSGSSTVAARYRLPVEM